MNTEICHLDQAKTQSPDRVTITVKNPLDAGDAGRMIAMHGFIYKRDCGSDWPDHGEKALGVHP